MFEEEIGGRWRVTRWRNRREKVREEEKGVQ